MAKRDLGDVAVKALTRPGIGSAFLAGLGVYLVLVIQRLLGTVADVVGSVPWNQDVGGYIVRIIPNDLPATLGAPLPFALGVVFAFWQLAPVVPQLRMAHVVTRSILAALVGAAAALVIGGSVALIANYTAWDAYYQFGTGPSRLPARGLRCGACRRSGDSSPARGGSRGRAAGGPAALGMAAVASAENGSEGRPRRGLNFSAKLGYP